MNDPFVYKHTNILRNKLNLKNQEDLDQYESAIFQLSFTKLIEEGFKITSTLDVLKLHKLLFGDVYDWAGETRTINIEKREAVLVGASVNYGDKNNIEKDLNNLNISLKSLKIDEENKSNLAKLIASIWQIHPFREGNTRTIVVFLYFLLNQQNLTLDIDLLEKHSKYFRNSLVLASIGEYSEYEHLQKILKDAIFSSGKSTKEKGKSISTKYDKIKDLELSKYKYNYHTKK